MKRSAKVCSVLVLSAMSAALTGCLPRQLVIWSPDGTRAVVATQEATFICDGDGKLTPTDIGVVSAAAWMPDSKQALLAVQVSARKWADLAGALDEPTIKAVAVVAGELEKAVLQIPEGQDLTDEQMQEIAKKVFDGKGSLASAALLMLRDTRPDALKKRMGEKWASMENVSVAYAKLGLYSLDGMSLKPGDVVLNSLRAIAELRLSPDAKAVVIVTASDATQQAFALSVAPVTAKATAVELADMVAVFPDWSDNQTVVYIESAGKKDDKPVMFGSLMARQVLDANAAIAAEMPEVNELAPVIFDQTQVIRCLPDGRIVFASAQMNIPAVDDQLSKDARLFAITPGQPAKPLLPADANVPASPIFEMSPDHKNICVIDGASVAVISIAEGKVTWALKSDGKLQMLPSWRKSDELCFMIPPAKDAPQAKPAVALWSAGQTRIISKDWPDSVLTNLTFAPQQKPPATQPATAPATAPGEAK